MGCGKGKKLKVCTLDIAPLCESSRPKRSGMARLLKGSHSLPAHPQIHPQSE